MSIQDNHTHIDVKYAFNIQMLTQDVNLFWSKRNIQKLSTFYTMWAQDLVQHHFDPFEVLQRFHQTLEELLNPSSGEPSKVRSQKGDGSSKELLTRLELQSVIQSNKTILTHKVALATLQVPMEHKDLPEQIQEHSSRIEKSYHHLNANTNRIVEKSFQLSELDIVSQEQITLINYEIDALILEFERSFSESPEALLDFLQGKKGVFKSKKSFLEALSELFLKKISILKSLNSTTMNAHLDWVTTMIMVRSKIGTSVIGINPSEKVYSKFVKVYREVESKEIQVIEASHAEFIEASGKYEEYNILLSENTQNLFLTSLRNTEILLYNFDQKQFIKVDLNQYMPDEASVVSALEQIKCVIRLLFNNSPEMIEIAKRALGPVYTLSNAIVTLFNKMFRIQKMYLTHSGKVLKITEKFDRELQENIRRHLEQTYEFAKTSSLKSSIQLKDFFASGSSSHFYLKLALDLKIHTAVKPKEMPDLIFLELIRHAQTENDLENEDTHFDTFASNRAQRKALEYYREIRKLDQTVKVHKGLERSTLGPEIRAHKIKSIVHIFENEGKALIQEIRNSLVIADVDQLDRMTPFQMRETAKQCTQRLQPGAFCEKHKQALFYIDLLFQLGHECESFCFNGESIVLNSIQVLILEEITSHFRLTTLRIAPAARDITALAQLVQSGDLQTSSEVVSIQDVQGQISKRIKKTRDKFTEILIHGLRSYHSMLSTLTTFLDWQPKHLQIMFENYLIKQHLKKQSKDVRKISNLEVRRFREGKLAKATFITKKAAELVEQFTEHLVHYRNLQLNMIQFYNALGNVAFQYPDYMTLKTLSEDDITFLKTKLDIVKIGHFNDIDVKTATLLKPHLAALEEVIKATPPKEQAKAVNRFLQTTMIHEDLPPLKKGLPLHLAGVTYMSIKLLIRTLQIIEKGSSFQGLNVDLFNQLFASQDSLWKKFSNATSKGVGEKVENAIGQFIKSPLTGAPALGFYFDLEPQTDDLWEYYQVNQPFLMMTAIITVQNKWNCYLGDLMKLLDERQFGASFRAIQEAALSLNDEERLRESLQVAQGASLKRRGGTTIFSDTFE